MYRKPLTAEEQNELNMRLYEQEKRDRLERFTLAAMQGLCASPLCNDIGQDTLVKWAVNLAQATIKALDEVK
jgi:hypothetical protein